MSLELQMIVADFESDDDVKYSILPSDVFGLPEQVKVTDAGVQVLADFNLMMADRHIVALPSSVQGVTGVFVVKTLCDMTDNDLSAIRMFAEPVFNVKGAVALLHAEAVAKLLEEKV